MCVLGGISRRVTQIEVQHENTVNHKMIISIFLIATKKEAAISLNLSSFLNKDGRFERKE